MAATRHHRAPHDIVCASAVSFAKALKGVQGCTGAPQADGHDTAAQLIVRVPSLPCVSVAAGLKLGVAGLARLCARSITERAQWQHVRYARTHPAQSASGDLRAREQGDAAHLPVMGPCTNTTVMEAHTKPLKS